MEVIILASANDASTGRGYKDGPRFLGDIRVLVCDPGPNLGQLTRLAEYLINYVFKGGVPPVEMCCPQSLNAVSVTV